MLLLSVPCYQRFYLKTLLSLALWSTTDRFISFPLSLFPHQVDLPIFRILLSKIQGELYLHCAVWLGFPCFKNNNIKLVLASMGKKSFKRPGENLHRSSFPLLCLVAAKKVANCTHMLCYVNTVVKTTIAALADSELSRNLSSQLLELIVMFFVSFVSFI